VETSFDKSKIRVLLLESVSASAVELLRSAGYTSIETHRGSLNESELESATRDVHLLGIRSRTQVTERVLTKAKKLIGIGCFCIGTDQVDLNAAEARGVPVFNAPFSNTRSVAELVLGEIVMLLRGIPERNAAAHAGGWMKTVGGSVEARGKSLGIVGYGHVGSQLGLLAESMGMHVLFHDVQEKLALGNATRVGNLDALLKGADVVSLHVPEDPTTRGLIGARELALMRPGRRLINASRGSVVDIAALVDALDSGHLAGAALDVFPAEPRSDGEPFASPLQRFPNVLLTPHIGGSTQEAQEGIGVEVAAKLVRYSDNGSTLTAVNFPEVTLPEHRDKHRLLHIHRNEPGVLAAINSIFADAKVNVASQYLETSRQVGYAVIDLDGADRPLSAGLRDQLREIDATIRTRVLY
jgi:D-3-phosphoglycerate dehydrogenase